MVAGKTLLAVFFLGVCVHAAYVVGLAVLPASLNLNEGDAFSLNCIASSIDGDVKWELNGKGIDLQALGFQVSQGRTTTITANFNSTQHEGSYRCSIKPSQGGRILSCPSNVRKAVLEEFGGSSKTVTAFVRGAAILPCTVPYSVPKANISLKKKGAARKVGPQSRQLLTSGSFYVQGLRAKDAGMYRCLADNDMTGTRTKSPFVTLQVEAVPSNSTTFEVAYISPDTVARAGDDVFLGCTFKAATLPEYQWMYRGLNGANATHLLETTSGLLELRAVKLEDAGMYECVASINDGERPLRQSVLLTVKAIPSEVTIAEERDSSGVVSLTCNVDPPGGLYNITWNIPDSTTIDGSVGLRGDTITITPDLAASGVYQCLASNEYGCATGEKTLVFEGITSSPSLLVSPTSFSTFAPEVTQLFSPTSLITDEVVESYTTPPTSSIPDPTFSSTSSSSEVEPMATSADSSSAIPSRSMTSSVGVSSSSDVTSSSESPTQSLAVPYISSVPSSSISVAPSVAGPSSSSVYRAASSSPPPAVPTPTPTPSGPQVNIDPSGELTVEEGDNVTVTCTSNVAGALLQLLILMDRFTSSHSVVASAEDTVLSHTFYFIRGSADGRYWCTLSDLRSENLEISVAAVAPTFKLENVSVYWVRDAKVNVSWSLPDPPPWMGVLGYKLNWDKMPPIAIALMSVGAETSSVEVDVNFTGVVFISVWAFSRGGEGPPVLLNVTIPMTTTTPSTSTSTSTPKPLLVLFQPLEATVAMGNNYTVTCWSNQEAVLQLAYNEGPVLASSSGRSVTYTLVDVQEENPGVIYCVGMVGEMSITTEFHLTVCTPLPVYTMSCWAVSPSKINVTLQGGPAPKGGFTVHYLLEGSLHPRHSKVVSEGLSTTLTGLTPTTRYRIAVSVEGCDTHTVGPCMTETLVNLTLPSTEPGMTMSLEMFEDWLEALRESLAEEEIDDDRLEIQVDKGNGWEEVQFDDIAAIESDQRNITFRVRINEGPWAESVVSLEDPETLSPTSSSGNIDWTLFSIYIILLSVAIVLAIVVTCVVVLMKYIQIQRREKDKVTDHRDEQAKRLSRQGSTRSTRSTVSWMLKMKRSESPEVKI